MCKACFTTVWFTVLLSPHTTWNSSLNQRLAHNLAGEVDPTKCLQFTTGNMTSTFYTELKPVRSLSICNLINTNNCITKIPYMWLSFI